MSKLPETKASIQLLQLFVCQEFETKARDCYLANAIQSNLVVPKFPAGLPDLYLVTCWRKDSRFHKEVIEYIPEKQKPVRTPHMDIEPACDSILFRWHKHRFPSDLILQNPGILTLRVFLDGHMQFETYLLVEQGF